MPYTSITRILGAVLGGVTICLSLCSPVAAGDDDDKDKWRDVQYEPDVLAFSQAFRDSLAQAKNVTWRRGMRSVPARALSKPEKFVYDVGWGPMRAGWGIIITKPDTASGLIHLMAKGMSNNFVSTFYKVRDFLYSPVDIEGLYPYFFEEHLREGRYDDDRWTLYDHENGLVYTHKKKYKKVEAPRFSQSVVSLLFYVRCMDLAPGDTFTIPTFVQGKNYQVFFRTDSKLHTVKVDAGRFECILVEPKLTGKGRVFTKKDKIRIWLSNDSRKIPVLIKSRVAVGSINVRLIHSEP